LSNYMRKHPIDLLQNEMLVWSNHCDFLGFSVDEKCSF